MDGKKKVKYKNVNIKNLFFFIFVFNLINLHKEKFERWNKGNNLQTKKKRHLEKKKISKEKREIIYWYILYIKLKQNYISKKYLTSNWGKLLESETVVQGFK